MDKRIFPPDPTSLKGMFKQFPEATRKRIIENGPVLRKLVDTNIAHIEEIRDEVDKEVIAVYLDALQVISDQIANIAGLPHRNIKETIRRGSDPFFSIIRQKLILLELV